MRAIEISAPGAPDVLVLGDRPMPVAGADDVLIKVAAAGVNRPDIAQRKGVYPPPPGASDIPGTRSRRHGRRARRGRQFIFSRRSSLRARHRRRIRRVLRRAGGAMPAGAARPLDGRSRVAPGKLFHRLEQRLRPRASAERRLAARAGWIERHRRLRHSARQRIRSRVFATAGSAEKCAACERLGAERAINYKTEDFVELDRRQRRMAAVSM